MFLGVSGAFHDTSGGLRGIPENFSSMESSCVGFQGFGDVPGVLLRVSWGFRSVTGLFFRL